MKRLARDLATIKPTYTAVVIGSGYGGGVAAARIARAGQSVCVLERGREIVPSEFPDTSSALNGEVQVDTELGRLGDRTALFDIRMNRDITAVIGCGLGGTSLINANVSLEMDPSLFSVDEWPSIFRENPHLLDPYYERARGVLGPTPYPADRPSLNKTAALEESAKALGATFYRPPINVTFVDQINPFGVYQPACNNCGDCCSGCNYGSKNTTLMNYLPDADNHGAEIFCRASVRWIERDGDQWVVQIESLDPAVPDTSVRADVVVVAAGTLGSTEILARSRAHGLALSPRLGDHFSGNGDVLAFGYDAYWKHRPANGSRNAPPADGMGDDTLLPIYGVGKGANRLRASQMPGPCITGIIDMRDAPDLEDRLVVEEGVIPGALAPLLTPGFFGAEATSGSPLAFGPTEAQSRLETAQAIAKAIQTSPGALGPYAYEGPVGRTQTYLLMSHDDAGGRMELRDDRLRIAWPRAGAEQVFGYDNGVLGQVASAIHGQYLPNPLSSAAMGQQLVTVHPVGGCRMGDAWTSGVVDDRCRVYESEHEVHDGLYVCDGSVLPGAVGVNPLLTITAVSERALELMAHDRGWTVDDAMTPPRPGHRTFAAPRPGIAATPVPRSGLAAGVHHVLVGAAHLVAGVLHRAWRIVRSVLAVVIRRIIKWVIARYPDRVSPGMGFTETMAGFYSNGDDASTAPEWERIADPFELASATGQAAGSTMDFRLTISTDDVHHMTVAPDHPATANGEVHCAALSASPMTVRGGTFQLLPPDPDVVNTWLMIYDLPLERTDGPPLHFRGTKYLRRVDGSSPWTDLTTLFVTITAAADATDLADPAGASRAPGTPVVVGRSILTLDVQDFIRQASTLTITPRERWFTRIGFLNRAFNMVFLGRFVGFFGETVLQAYGSLLSDLADFDRQADAIRTPRPLAAPACVRSEIRTDDGFTLVLYRYQGGTKGPVVLAPGFSVNATSFAIDTVDQNVVEYLCANGYDVWLLAYRGSPDSGSSTRPFEIDDIASYDWPAAIGYIRNITGAADVQVVAHCVASMTLLMSLLDGLEGVRSVVSSQLTLHPVVDWLNDLKADIGIVPLVRRMDFPKLGVDLRDKIDFRSSGARSDSVIDTALWMVPVPDGEACTNPCCRRVFALIGPSYTHAQLNHETHVAMREMFGEIGTKPFVQLADIIERGYVVDAAGRDRYLPNVERLRLPIDFLVGNRNDMFLPETSARTLDWLVAHNGPDLYTRHVFDGYAHMDLWIGRTASRDVFPYLLERLDRFN